MTIYTTHSNNTIKAIRQGDPDFMIHDGNIMSARAGIEISQRCPDNYKSLIQECINHGWLKSVAYIKESDYVWEKLGD